MRSDVVARPDGRPATAGPAILEIADAERPPLRVFFGTVPTQLAPHVYQERLATWDEWKRLSIAANG